MAKKVVATLKDSSKVNMTKVVVPIWNEKTQNYSFKEEMLLNEEVSGFIAKHSKK